MIQAERPVIYFRDHFCIVRFALYRQNSQPAILLVDQKTGKAIATATVCLPEIDLAPGRTLIKDYSENEGILDLLTEAGIVRETGNIFETGFAHVYEVELVK